MEPLALVVGLARVVGEGDQVDLERLGNVVQQVVVEDRRERLEVVAVPVVLLVLDAGLEVVAAVADLDEPGQRDARLPALGLVDLVDERAAGPGAGGEMEVGITGVVLRQQTGLVVRGRDVGFEEQRVAEHRRPFPLATSAVSGVNQVASGELNSSAGLNCSSFSLRLYITKKL